MREQQIERALHKRVGQMHGMALKCVTPGYAGVPDRLVLLPGGKVVFVEVKSPGTKLRPLQQKRKAQLEDLGFRVIVIDGKEAIQNFLESEVMP